MREPKIFLFDEPLSNLDAELRVSMRGEIVALHQRLGTTMIYVTHDQVEAMTMADKIVVLRAGRIEQVGAPLELYNAPAQPLRRRLHRLAADELRAGDALAADAQVAPPFERPAVRWCPARADGARRQRADARRAAGAPVARSCAGRARAADRRWRRSSSSAACR